MKKTGKIIIVVLVAVIAAGAVIYWLTRPKVTYDTEKVSRGSVIEEVSVTGSIAPVSKIELQPEVSGKVVSIPVKEGDEVNSGDLLISIDPRDTEAKVASQRAAVESARAQLRELQTGATAEELKVTASAVDTAKAQLAAAVSAKADAETALQNAQTGAQNTRSKADTLIQSKLNSLLLDYNEAATIAADAVDRLVSPLFTTSDFLSFTSVDAQAESDATSTRLSAKSALDPIRSAALSANATDTVDAAKNNYAVIVSGLTAAKSHVDACAAALNYAMNLSPTTLASYQLNVSTAQSGLNAIISKITNDKSGLDLQQRLNAADITASDIAVSGARAAVSSAGHAIETSQSAVGQAQAAYDLKKSGARREVIDAQRAQVAAQEAALSGLLTTLSKYSITAPIDSVVTSIPVELGETVQPGRTAVMLNARDHFEIISNISEVDIVRIAVGQSVTITLDAFSASEKWTGKVISIQPAEKVVEGVIFYETKVIFDQDDPQLKSGMTANLDIETNRQDNVLRVPLRSLKESPGRQYVDVLDNGKTVQKDVTTGIESTDFIEIKSGLNEGETVIIASNGTK